MPNYVTPRYGLRRRVPMRRRNLGGARYGKPRRKAPFRKPVRRGNFRPKPELKAAHAQLLRQVSPTQPGDLNLPANTEWCVQCLPDVSQGTGFDQRLGRAVQMRWLVIRFSVRGRLEELGPPAAFSTTNIRYIFWKLKNGALTTRAATDLDWNAAVHTVGQPKFPGVCTMNGFIDTTKVTLLRSGYMSVSAGDTSYKQIKFDYPKYRRINYENPLNNDPPDTQLDPGLQGTGDDPVGSSRIYLSFVADDGAVIGSFHAKQYYIDD